MDVIFSQTMHELSKFGDGGIPPEDLAQFKETMSAFRFQIRSAIEANLPAGLSASEVQAEVKLQMDKFDILDDLIDNKNGVKILKSLNEWKGAKSEATMWDLLPGYMALQAAFGDNAVQMLQYMSQRKEQANLILRHTNPALYESLKSKGISTDASLMTILETALSDSVNGTSTMKTLGDALIPEAKERSKNKALMEAKEKVWDKKGIWETAPDLLGWNEYDTAQEKQAGVVTKNIKSTLQEYSRELKGVHDRGGYVALTQDKDTGLWVATVWNNLGTPVTKDAAGNDVVGNPMLTSKVHRGLTDILNNTTKAYPKADGSTVSLASDPLFRDRIGSNSNDDFVRSVSYMFNHGNNPEWLAKIPDDISRANGTVPSGDEDTDKESQAGASSDKNPSTNKWDNYIFEASKAFGVDPALIKAVMAAESSFNEGATSPTGVKGLMQVTQATFDDLTDGKGDRTDPLQSTYAGAKYLSILLKRYGGDVELALSAYNGALVILTRLKQLVIRVYKETRRMRTMHLECLPSMRNLRKILGNNLCQLARELGT